MSILIDNFPFDLSEPLDFDAWQVEYYSLGGWGGPITPETEAARLAGLKAAWNDAEERRAEHSMRLKAMRPTMPQGRPHASGMTPEHKANLSKAQMGNTNSKKPHKYPATRKKPINRATAQDDVQPQEEKIHG